MSWIKHLYNPWSSSRLDSEGYRRHSDNENQLSALPPCYYYPNLPKEDGGVESKVRHVIEVLPPGAKYVIPSVARKVGQK